ncbi:MAG: hypothetical protein ACLP1E_14850 [Acidimicrobiales bacterium]
MPIGRVSRAAALAASVPFYERLYQAAQRLLEDSAQDEFSFAGAVIVSGTACETAVGVVITTIISQRDLGPIAEAANESMRSYNLRDPHDRTTWNAITENAIHDESFWKRYMEHVKRRNDVVHTGRIEGNPVTRQDAEEAIAAARQLLDHVTAVLGAKSN